MSETAVPDKREKTEMDLTAAINVSIHSVKFLANTISPQKISSYFGTSNKKFTADIWLKTDSSYYLIDFVKHN